MQSSFSFQPAAQRHCAKIPVDGAAFFAQLWHCQFALMVFLTFRQDSPSQVKHAGAFPILTQITSLIHGGSQPVVQSDLAQQANPEPGDDVLSGVRLHSLPNRTRQ
jgi:hypothetical protein